MSQQERAAKKLLFFIFTFMFFYRIKILNLRSEN